MLHKSLRYPELKGLICGFVLVAALGWLFWPQRIAWLPFADFTSPSLRIFIAILKALCSGIPLGWSSWSAWCEWHGNRLAECKMRLRWAGALLLCIQLEFIGLQLFTFPGKSVLASAMRHNPFHFIGFYALNPSLIWSLLLLLISAFVPKTERQKVQITRNLRL